MSSLAQVASKLCEETPVTLVTRGSLRRRAPGPVASSPEGSPLRRTPLPKHFEITQETARLLSKLHNEVVPKAPCCPDPQPEEAEDHLWPSQHSDWGGKDWEGVQCWGVWRVPIRKDYMAWGTKTLSGAIYQDPPTRHRSLPIRATQVQRWVRVSTQGQYKSRDPWCPS